MYSGKLNNLIFPHQFLLLSIVDISLLFKTSYELSNSVSRSALKEAFIIAFIFLCAKMLLELCKQHRMKLLYVFFHKIDFELRSLMVIKKIYGRKEIISVDRLNSLHRESSLCSYCRRNTESITKSPLTHYHILSGTGGGFRIIFPLLLLKF